MTDRELFTMVLESLERLNRTGDTQVFDMFDAPVLIPALRARLAQPEQKPVVWRYRGNLHEFDPSDWASGEVTPLYTAPPQREWIGLTHEEHMEILTRDLTAPSRIAVAEAKLKDKNI